jgi:hypothetical protein
MSHFSSADESCKHENDEEGSGDGRSGDERSEGGEGEGEGKDCEEGTCFAKEELFAAAKSRWHETREVPITATDLSVLLMMRRSRSSLLPG